MGYILKLETKYQSYCASIDPRLLQILLLPLKMSRITGYWHGLAKVNFVFSFQSKTLSNMIVVKSVCLLFFLSCWSCFLHHSLFCHQLAALAPSSPNRGTVCACPAQPTAVPAREQPVFAPVETVITAQTQILPTPPALVSNASFSHLYNSVRFNADNLTSSLFFPSELGQMCCNHKVNVIVD